MFILILNLLLQFSLKFSWSIEKPIENKIKKIQIYEGEKINIKQSGPVWVENGDHIKVITLKSPYQVQGLKAGFSDLRIGKVEYYVEVLSRAQNRTAQLLAQFAKKSLNLHIEKDNSVIALKGRLTSINEWEKIAIHCINKNCEYEMQASFSNQIQKLAQNKLDEILKQNSLYPFRLEFTHRVQIHVSKKYNQYEKLRTILNRYGISIVKDDNAIDIQPLVKVQITVAEVKRDEFIKHGIDWPATYTAQVLPKLQDASGSVEMTLNALEANGLGRVLASPNILCRSGKDAEFLAGGEFPIKIINQKIQDVVWKKYGVVLKIKPIADFTGRMRISLETEVSSIDPNRTVDGIPGLFTNRVQSHFDLQEPRTIALSGLLKREMSEVSTGIPGLSRIPILGSLFSSKEFRENRTELVIFVRPEIIENQEVSND